MTSDPNVQNQFSLRIYPQIYGHDLADIERSIKNIHPFKFLQARQKVSDTCPLHTR